MKYLLFLLVPFFALGQSPEANSIRFKDNTTAERDAYSSYVGGIRMVWNVTTQQIEYSINGGAWNNLIQGGEANDGFNLGAGASVFAQKVGVSLQFKSIVAGTNVTINEDANSIYISSTGGGAGGGSSNTVNQLIVGTNNADATHLVTYNSLESAGTATVEIPADATYDFPAGTVLEYTSTDPANIITLTYESPATGPALTTSDANGWAIAVQKTGENAWAVINTKTDVGVYSQINGKTEATQLDNTWLQTENGLTTDGSPPVGELAYCTDCAPADGFTGTTIPLDGFYQHDDTATDTATWTIGTFKNGGYAEILINLATEPTVTGATQIPDTPSFTPNVLQVLTVKSISGSVRYYYTRL